MRGKDAAGAFWAAAPGITPAYAGKSFAAFLYSVVRRDHPRLCGEKNQTTGNEGRLVGSPPPMRGKAGQFVDYVQRTRITPAYAGKRRGNAES